MAYEFTDLSGALRMVRQSELPHYVYLLARPDGRIFYVGKGRKGRLRNHTEESYLAKEAHTYKARIIRKVLSSGEELRYAIDSFHQNEVDAFLRERFLIETIDNLTNVMGGGDGLGNPSKEFREQQRARMCVRMNDIELRAKAISALLKPETRAKANAGARDYWTKKSSRDAARERMKKRFQNPEEHKRMKKIAEEYWKSDEAREAAKQRMAARWESDDLREQMVAATRTSTQTPEFRAWASENSKRVNAMPHVREAKRKSLIERMSKPEEVAKVQRNLRTPEAIAKRSQTIKHNNALRRMFREKCDALRKEYAVEFQSPSVFGSYKPWEETYRYSLAMIGVLDG